MPPTPLHNTAELAIELDEWRIYAPGDVVTGKIVRKTSLVSPQARLNVSLRGRAKSNMIVRTSNSTHRYRGRFNFFGAESTQELQRGPIHIAPGGEPKSWPFAIMIPLTPSAAALAGDMTRDKDESYLPLDEVAKQPIPDVFFYGEKIHMARTKFFGYVEYHIDAELNMVVHDRNSTTKATLPILVRSPGSPRTLSGDDFAMKTASTSNYIKSYRLLAETPDSKLSFKQKWRSSYGSSDIPYHSFRVQAFYPSRLQLGADVPFSIRILPDLPKSSEHFQDTPLEYKLESLSLKLKATTTVLCAGTFAPHDASATEKYKFPIEPIIERLKEPLVLPVGEKAEPLDLGSLFQLSFDESGAKALGKNTPYSPEKTAHPSFQTYNIRRTYDLEWKMSLHVGNKESAVKCDNFHVVTVLGPSQEQAQGGMTVPEMNGKGGDYAAWMAVGLGGVGLGVGLLDAFAG